jgi:predicted RNase H-like nuclease (RuvC/YqgF family)
MFNDKKIREMERRIDTLQFELERKREEIQRLKHEIETKKPDYRNATFSFNFNAVKAFSVERLPSDKGVATVIGYIVKDNVKEWHLYCSDEQHERLVKEFEQSRK